eukprot:CAMPEP_0174948478 /NCGR_PEP_ID=MMETSP1355-20121228/89165_1 /TAXON_ID=464990 /ORGANISM="Hemiselmis tepida, Strain CCMP443" /LENGTH=121 /DNA_ID=CAMNT_0016195993 /DNA_START=24 /DNA_END=385 /DNA_ORIENTATION=-
MSSVHAAVTATDTDRLPPVPGGVVHRSDDSDTHVVWVHFVLPIHASTAMGALGGCTKPSMSESPNLKPSIATVSPPRVAASDGTTRATPGVSHTIWATVSPAKTGTSADTPSTRTTNSRTP